MTKKIEMNQYIQAAMNKAKRLEENRVNSVLSYLAHNRANRYFVTIQADKKRGGIVIELSKDDMATIVTSEYASPCFDLTDGRVRSSKAFWGWLGVMRRLDIEYRITWEGDYIEGLAKCYNGSRSSSLEQKIAEITGGEWIGEGEKSATATRTGQKLRQANTFVRADIRYTDENGKTIGYGEVKCAAGHWDYIK